VKIDREMLGILLNLYFSGELDLMIEKEEASEEKPQELLSAAGFAVVSGSSDLSTSGIDQQVEGAKDNKKRHGWRKHKLQDFKLALDKIFEINFDNRKIIIHHYKKRKTTKEISEDLDRSARQVRRYKKKGLNKVIRYLEYELGCVEIE